ncbi:MAG: hypothetical protein JW836_16985 [Deltaproteobacteria bacterium]|nr:hypothetical protein [Deltaproteobacteria bacterium]
MNENYRAFFGFTREPFTSDLALKEILQTAELTGVQKRFDYALRLGGIGLVTGEIGSGKSTALRYASGQLHPSEYQSFYVIASSGSTHVFSRNWGGLNLLEAERRRIDGAA